MIYAYARTGTVLYKSVSEAKAMMGQSDRYILALYYKSTSSADLCGFAC